MAKLIKVWDGTQWQTVAAAATTGPTGPTGPKGIVSQTTPPGDTGVLWLDTDEPAVAATVASSLDYVSGQFYRPQGSQSTQSATTNTVYYSVLFVPKTQTFDRIALKTSSSFSGTGSVRLGIYENTLGKPLALIADYGTVSPTTSSTTFSITINKTLEPGFYWLAAVQQTAPTTGSYSGNTTNLAAYQNYQNLPYDPSMTTGSVVAGYIQTGVSGSFSTAIPVATAGAMAIVPFLRAG
jgi:hypothetical protein